MLFKDLKCGDTFVMFGCAYMKIDDSYAVIIKIYINDIHEHHHEVHVGDVRKFDGSIEVKPKKVEIGTELLTFRDIHQGGLFEDRDGVLYMKISPHCGVYEAVRLSGNPEFSIFPINREVKPVLGVFKFEKNKEE